jgi:hypothetical protein
MALNYKQGIFTPKYPEKYIGDVKNIQFRSGWELKFMNWADTNLSVVKWCSEELVIPYFSPVDMKMHRYFPDFIMEVQDRNGATKKYVVEVKPSAQTLPPKQNRNKKRLLEETKTYAVNNAKWDAAKSWCQEKGFEFIIITEKHLKV